MGIYIGRSRSSYDDELITNLVNAANKQPDPSNWVFEDHFQGKKHLLLKVKYPNCRNNYEGIKILLFKDITLADILKQKVLDPHFSKSTKFHSPFARFAPTEEGWNKAISFITFMENE